MNGKEREYGGEESKYEWGRKGIWRGRATRGIVIIWQRAEIDQKRGRRVFTQRKLDAIFRQKRKDLQLKMISRQNIL